MGLYEELEQIAAERVDNALRANNNNVGAAAEALGLNRTTLSEMLKRRRERGTIFMQSRRAPSPSAPPGATV